VAAELQVPAPVLDRSRFRLAARQGSAPVAAPAPSAPLSPAPRQPLAPATPRQGRRRAAPRPLPSSPPPRWQGQRSGAAHAELHQPKPATRVLGTVGRSAGSLAVRSFFDHRGRWAEAPLSPCPFPGSGGCALEPRDQRARTAPGTCCGSGSGWRVRAQMARSHRFAPSLFR